MPASDEAVARLQQISSLSPNLAREALERAGGDVEAALVAQIDAGLVEARDLNPDAVSVQLFGRANVRQFLRKMEDFLRKAPGSKEFLKLAQGAKAAIDDPAALEQWGETLWQQAMERKHPELARQTEKEAKKAKKKVPTWNHPDLGRFTYDGVAWTKAMAVPAFKAFRYGGRANGKCELTFDADDASEVPTPTAISVAAAVLNRPDDLVKKLITALWDDFNGRGRESGMYWHGDLDAVTERLEWDDDAKPPHRAEDLFKLLFITHTSRSARKWHDTTSRSWS